MVVEDSGELKHLRDQVRELTTERDRLLAENLRLRGENSAASRAPQKRSQNESQGFMENLSLTYVFLF